MLAIVSFTKTGGFMIKAERRWLTATNFPKFGGSIKNDKIMEIEGSKNYELHKRRELMADGRRYIIYYTFGENAGESAAQPNDRLRLDENKVTTEVTTAETN
jgi:hypothetical protein